jgi:methylated-DNA-[protein]-cysteine S-methyltransferase
MNVRPGITFCYYIFQTKEGYMGAVRTYRGLYSLLLPERSAEAIKNTIKSSFKKLKSRSKPFIRLKKKIKAYFSGKNVRFNLKLDLGGFSDFDKKVFAVTATIPRGQTRSYSWIARLIGDNRYSRAVGQALSRNRLPIIIPCHRVIGKKDFGGFSYGMDNKRMLLKAEGRLW